MVAHGFDHGAGRRAIQSASAAATSCGLLGKERVTGVLDHDDRHAIAELVLHLLAGARGPERVLVGLQIQERRNPARPPLLLRDGGGRGALRLAKVWMPAGQPDAWDRCAGAKKALRSAASRTVSGSAGSPALSISARRLGSYCLDAAAAITTPRTSAG